jgi:putative tricarboxylic transport membrane protein
VAFKFGPAEYFSLMVLGLIGAVVLASGSLIKAIGMIVLGLLLGLVGTDVNSGVARFSFDVPELTDGIGFIVIAMGVFGYGEIISNLGKHESEREVFTAKVQGLMPTAEDFKRMLPAVLRGTLLGSVLGILPGGGALLSAFAAYTIEKKTKLKPGEVPFGKGNIRGVAAPESANNAASQTSFIPLLTLGIPPNAVMALMVGAMTIHNIQPGPQVMTSNPGLFWGLIASMWIGNAMLIILNLPLIGMWIKLLTVPYRWLFPAIVLFCAIGVYSTNNNTWDIWMVAIFGVVGYLFIKLGMRARPLAAGLHPGADDGGEPATRAAAVARRLERLWSRAACRPRCWHGAAAADDRAAACGEEQAPGGLQGRGLRRSPAKRSAFCGWSDVMQKAGVNPAFCMGHQRCALLRAAWCPCGE